MIRTLLSAAALSITVAVVAPLVADAQPARVHCPNGGSDYCNFTIEPGFTPDPLTGTGQSGGDNFTNDCGYINGPPDHVLTVTEGFSYLRAHVVSQGDVSLVVSGPDGRFCRDDVNGLLPELYGTWPAGTYRIWIGDWGQNYYPYTLYLTEFTFN